MHSRVVVFFSLLGKLLFYYLLLKFHSTFKYPFSHSVYLQQYLLFNVDEQLLMSCWAKLQLFFPFEIAVCHEINELISYVLCNKELLLRWIDLRCLKWNGCRSIKVSSFIQSCECFHLNRWHIFVILHSHTYIHTYILLTTIIWWRRKH